MDSENKKEIVDLADQKFFKFLRDLNSGSKEALGKTAIIDTDRQYTYRQMFRQWDRYAEVFSSLGITAENHSRVGLGSHFVFREQLFSLYALNMIGASVSMFSLLGLMDIDSFSKTIQKEKITDMVLTDLNFPPSALEKLIKRKKDLGLRNIILIHTPLRSLFVPEELAAINKLNYKKLRKMEGVIWMEDALTEYEAMPVFCDHDDSREAALILHTSGSTSGIRKPVPFSDKEFNNAVARIMSSEQFQTFKGRAVTCLYLPLDIGTSLVDVVHLTLCYGGTLVLDSFGCANGNVIPELVQKYHINYLLAGPKIIGGWKKLPKLYDLSSLEYVVSGGSYLSPEAKEQVDVFLKKCGSKVGLSNGYGLTELGSACFLAPQERKDVPLGFPLPGLKVKLLDENENRYYDIEDGPRTGVLMLSSNSLSSGRIGDDVFFQHEKIDGEDYLNTYDLVELKEDGSFVYIGRMNKYFVNNDGIKFDSGLVETAISKAPGIQNCALAPYYEKIDLHDTIPVLYVETKGEGKQKKQIVTQALRDIFIKDDAISKTNLPGQCVITNKIPFNTAGKVDTLSILEGKVAGKRYKVEPVWDKDRLVNIILMPAAKSKNGTINSQSGTPKELRGGAKSDSQLILELQGEMMKENLGDAQEFGGECFMKCLEELISFFFPCLMEDKDAQ